MASLGVKIDPTQHDTDTQRGDFKELPNGIYTLEVDSADVKKSGEGTGRKVGLNLAMTVIEPEEFKGSKIFNYINLEHPTAKAQEIGQADFAKLCRALGISHAPDDTDELMFISFTAEIGMGKPSKEKNADGLPQYPAKNEIKKYFYPDEGVVPAAKADPTPPANDNRRAPANDNRQPAAAAAPAARPAGSKPWGGAKK
jgi:hypothetical protein